MKKQLFVLLCILCLALSGCGDNHPAKTASPVPISVSENIPYAVVGEAYDLSALIAEDDGVTYEFSATYQDPESGEPKTLNVRSGKITPRAEAEIAVTITATKGDSSSTAEFVIPIKISADVMDQRLAAQGFTTVTKDAAFIHEENSTSALEATFSQSASLFQLSDYALHPYYSAQVWDNAAVTFWVYNPAEQEVAFKLATHNPATGVSLDWDSPENTQVQIATPGQWTQIAFSLYDMGITQPLMNAATYQNEDSLQVLVRCEGLESCTIYIDKLDIVDAETIGLKTGFQKSPAPAGDYSDLLSTCEVYTEDSVASLEQISQGCYRFGSSQQAGYPVLYVDFPQVTDISGFDYLKFDVMGENCYPHLSVSVRYLDENGNIQQKGTSYDYYRNQWQTIYLNLDYPEADLTKAVGIIFSVHMDRNFVAGQFNSVSFRNVALYSYPEAEPQMSPAILEDNDIISGPFYTTGTKPNVNGVCKVDSDGTGNSRSNSTLLFWTNNACGYPNVEATFLFDSTQDWSGHNILSFDTHQAGGHYWLQFDLIYLDAEGRQQTAWWRHDTIMTNWQTNHASLDWFKTPDDNSIKPTDLTQVVGIKIQANMAINVTSEVAHIYFDNFVLS